MQTQLLEPNFFLTSDISATMLELMPGFDTERNPDLESLRLTLN
jgi:hypothetical protein